MRTFISMPFVSIITKNTQDEISLDELQKSYDEFIDAIIIESFVESKHELRYNALSYTLIELKSLQKESKDEFEVKKKYPRHCSSIQSN